MKAPINIAVSTKQGKYKRANGSRLLNLYPEIQAQGSKTPVVLYSTPGQYRFCSLPTGPVQGLCVMNDELYAATKTKLYRVSWNGSYTELGDILCVENASMATNGIHLVVVSGQRGYAYSLADGLTSLAGAGWYPANTVTHQDGYFIFNRRSTGQFFLSGLLSTDLDALDYATAEASPDDTLAIISDQRNLWLFGSESTEIWYNAGGDFPFQPIQGAYIERGIAAPFSAVKMDNGIFFLGDDGVVYRTSGYTVVRISDHHIEQQFLAGKISDAEAYSYSQEGHVFYVLTLPSKKKTVAYDASTGLWHERSHSVHGRHNARGYARCYNKDFIGDFQSGDIYALDNSAYTDNGDTIEREAIAPVLHNNQNRVSMYGLEIEIGSPGYKFTAGDSAKVTMQFSDDDCRTWSSVRTRDVLSNGNKQKRIKFGPLGQFLNRHIRLRITDPFPIAISGMYAEVQGDE